jgi:hypothetical protein
MVKKAVCVLATLLATSIVATPTARGQNPYGGNPSGNLRQGRSLPTFGVGSYESPQTGNYAGRNSGGLQSVQSYPPPPRVRRPVISPYLNLNRPEGIVGGVPNYFSLVKPRVEALNRYQSDVDHFRQLQEENARHQQELYRRQEQDFEALNKKIDQGRDPSSTRTQYSRPRLRSTGHATSFGVR